MAQDYEALLKQILEAAACYKNGQAAAAPAPAPAAAAPAPAPTPVVNNSGFVSYSPSCGSCGTPFTANDILSAPSPQAIQNSAAPIGAPAPMPGPGIDTNQLNAMIESMTKALRGE